jgi:hypothetical protein
MLLIEKYLQMQNVALLNILLKEGGGGVGVVHSFEYSGIYVSVT